MTGVAHYYGQDWRNNRKDLQVLKQYGRMTASARPAASVAPAPARRAAEPEPKISEFWRWRNTVCRSLTVAGARWTIDDVDKRMKSEMKGDRADLRCERRPGVAIRVDYALDVCLSSWCQECPFVVESR